MDILLQGGRVIDPELRIERVADVLIRGTKVIEVAPDIPVPGDARTVDVSGHIIGPGFVDLHSHVNTIAGQRLQAMDGVTTALELEAGLMPVERAYRQAALEGRPLNYGFSASWNDARAAILTGIVPDADFLTGLDTLGMAAWQASSTPDQLKAWLELLERDLDAGALGIGVLLGYAPKSDPAEFLAVAALAARMKAPTFTHVRELIEDDPHTVIDGSAEITIAAAETGAHMHHCHLNSTSRRNIDRVLRTIHQSQDAGSRVSVEAYPYGAGSTSIGAAFLVPERLKAWGIRPQSIVMVASGERIIDERHLMHIRQADPGAPCIVEFLDESDPGDSALLRQALAFDDSIVASDAMPVFWPDGSHESTEWPLPPGGATHPRTSGTFAKVLRQMVRETGRWTWTEAFRRCSFLPARVLDEVSPVARNKGRLAPGSDADLVVIDPSMVSDRATYVDPTRTSVGIAHLLVGGTFVVSDHALVTDAFPGSAVRGSR